MLRHYRFIFPALAFSLLYSGTPTALAVTDDDVAAAKREAAYAEAIKQRKVAEKDTADAAAALAEAQSKARLATEKAELDADKARTDYYKSLLPTAPDPTKYLIAAPSSPNLTATATYRNMEAIQDTKNGLTSNISQLIVKAINEDKSCKKTEKLILLEDSKIKPSIGLYKITLVFLGDANNQIETKSGELKKLLDNPISQRNDFAESSSLAPAVLSSLAETAISFANILRTQYITATASQTTLVDSMLTASVVGLIKNNINVMDPNAVIDTPLDQALLSSRNINPSFLLLNNSNEPSERIASPANTKTDADLSSNSNTLLGASALLMSNILEARKLMDSANERIKKDTDAARKKGPKSTFVSPLEKPVQELTALIELTHKQLLAFYLADAQGGIPFDIAQKGEIITEKLKMACVYILTLEVLSSDVDTIAADGLFKGYRVSMATNTAARWRLVMPNGIILATGVENTYTPWSKVQIPN